MRETGARTKWNVGEEWGRICLEIFVVVIWNWFNWKIDVIKHLNWKYEKFSREKKIYNK